MRASPPEKPARGAIVGHEQVIADDMLHHRSDGNIRRVVQHFHVQPADREAVAFLEQAGESDPSVFRSSVANNGRKLFCTSSIGAPIPIHAPYAP